MNSLEYIKKEIEDIEERIMHLTKKYKENKNFPSKDRFLAGWIKCCQEELQRLQQIKTELEEYEKLKDKATQKKIIKYTFDLHTGKCPSCGHSIHYWDNAYCQRCGQAIDWSEDNG